MYAASGCGEIQTSTGPLCLVTVMIEQKMKYLGSPLMSPNVALPVGHFISKEAKARREEKHTLGHLNLKKQCSITVVRDSLGLNTSLWRYTDHGERFIYANRATGQDGCFYALIT